MIYLIIKDFIIKDSIIEIDINEENEKKQKMPALNIHLILYKPRDKSEIPPSKDDNKKEVDESATSGT